MRNVNKNLSENPVFTNNLLTRCLDVAKKTSLIGSSTRNYSTQIKDFKEYFGQWKHAKVLFATSFSWFLL